MPQNSPFQYLTRAQVIAAISQRLNDPSNVFWTSAELVLYLNEALREWNVLTCAWPQDWTTTYTSTDKVWQSTGNSQNSLVGWNSSSPRFQTLRDSDVYTIAQYHLLEPPTGNGSWTGTAQFSLSAFTNALQRRRDAILQATACYLGPFSNSFGVTPGTSNVQLPDSASQSILDIRRVRYVPAANQGSPVTLFREDSLAFEYFDQTPTVGTPAIWDQIGSPPQSITLDTAPNVSNTLDILAVLSGGLISPPTESPLLMPDDWTWVLKWGMVADLLRMEVESTDLERADYCEMRFQEGLEAMKFLPWMTQARINNQMVDTPSIAEMDNFDNEWQTNPNANQVIVRGGIDLFAVSPTIPADTNVGVTMTLIGNAPIPADDSAYVQVSRDVLDVLIDEVQHLAQFKEGGWEFYRSIELHKNFVKAATETNDRLRESGIFDTTLYPKNSRQNAAQPRFAVEPQPQEAQK